MIGNIIRSLLPKQQIQRVEVSGCMADQKKILDKGFIKKKISKVIYGSDKPEDFYLCEFPDGEKELAVSRCINDKDTGIISYTL